MTEDEMVGQYHQLNGLEFEQAPGDDERQGRKHNFEIRGAGRAAGKGEQEERETWGSTGQAEQDRDKSC